MAPLWRSLLCATFIVSVCAAELERRWVKPSYLPHAFKELDDEQYEAIAGLVDIEYAFNNLFKPILIPRVVGTEGHKRVREFIKGRFRELGGWRLDEDTFNETTPHGIKQFTNLVYTLDPFAKRRLTLAAHYDSKFFARGKFLGASDSAMPCAMLLHMVEILDPWLKNYTYSSARDHDLTLQVIFMDGEEAFEQWSDQDSIYGAKHLAKLFSNTYVPVRKDVHSHAPHGDEHHYSVRREDEQDSDTLHLQAMDAMVLLDLLGQKNPVIPAMHSSSEHMFAKLMQIERILDLMDLLDKHDGVKYFKKSAEVDNSGIGDDHTPFEQLGVPILHLIAFPFPRFWHQLDDNEKIIDKSTSANLLRIFCIFVAEYLHML